MLFPCKSPFCPKHAHIGRESWAKRIETEFNQSRYNYSVTVPIGRLLTQHELTSFWLPLRAAWGYYLKPWRYCVMPEIQGDNLHLHGVLHCRQEKDEEEIKHIYFKFLRKKLGIEREGLRAAVKEYESGRATGQYVTKTGDQVKDIELPPRGLWRRMVMASRHYGKVTTTS